MDVNGTIKAAAKAAGIGITTVGLRLGHTRQYATTAMAGSVKAITLADLLAACGFALAAVPYAEELPAGSLVIDSPTLGTDSRKRELEQQLEKAKAEVDRLEQAISKLQAD